MQGEMILCACGCGTVFPKFDGRHRERRFIAGHAARVTNPPRVTTICEYCGKPSQRRASDIVHSKQYFCDTRCQGAYRKEHGLLRGPNNGHYNTITVPCSGCGAPVSKAASLINRRHGHVYCPTCIPLVFKTGRATPLPGNQAKSFRKLHRDIRERDNHTCQNCGRVQISSERPFDVHHIDYDRTHNDPMNLITLCRPCHGLTQFALAEWTARFTRLLGSRLVAERQSP